MYGYVPREGSLFWLVWIYTLRLIGTGAHRLAQYSIQWIGQYTSSSLDVE